METHVFEHSILQLWHCEDWEEPVAGGALVDEVGHQECSQLLYSVYFRNSDN